jgi:hypothetical protein
MSDRPQTEQYAVVTSSRGRPPVWTWEIQRRPTRLGIKVAEDGFISQSAAKLAGEKALVAFLHSLAKEELNA